MRLDLLCLSFEELSVLCKSVSVDITRDIVDSRVRHLDKKREILEDILNKEYPDFVKYETKLVGIQLLCDIFYNYDYHIFKYAVKLFSINTMLMRLRCYSCPVEYDNMTYCV